MTKEELEKRVKELEEELLARESDLALFRKEFERTNKKLENLIIHLGNEVQAAHAIQKALVPTKIPSISGFDFSTKFISGLQSGGDYFDIFEHDDRSRFGIIIASSSSYGMSALLISTLLKLTSQMETRSDSEPIQWLQRIAEELVPHIEDNATTDILYGLYDRRSSEFSFCKAGEIIGLHYDDEKGRLKLLEATSGSIKAHFSHDSSTSRRFILNPKDRLILCTRGLIEEKNTNGECYGQERLCEVILRSITKDTHALRNEILFQVQRFRGVSAKHEPSRDASVIVADMNDRIIRLAQ